MPITKNTVKQHLMEELGASYAMNEEVEYVLYQSKSGKVHSVHDNLKAAQNALTKNPGHKLGQRKMGSDNSFVGQVTEASFNRGDFGSYHPNGGKSSRIDDEELIKRKPKPPKENEKWSHSENGEVELATKVRSGSTSILKQAGSGKSYATNKPHHGSAESARDYLKSNGYSLKTEEVELEEVLSMRSALSNSLSKPEPGSKLDVSIKRHNQAVKLGLPKDHPHIRTNLPDGHHFDKAGAIRLGEGCESVTEQLHNKKMVESSIEFKLEEAKQLDLDLHIMFTKQMIEKQKKSGRSVKALEDKLDRMIAARKVNKRNSMREEVDLTESAYKPGTKVTVNGKNGEISYVKHSNDPDYPHNYKILDTDANDPYKQKHLENGHYIPHTRVKLAEEIELEEATYVVKHDGVESDHPDMDARKLFSGKSNITNLVTKYEDSARKTKKLLDGKGFKNVRIEKNGKALEESTVYKNGKIVKSKNGKEIGEIYPMQNHKNHWGVLHYASDHGADSIDSHEEAAEWLQDFHNEHQQSKHKSPTKLRKEETESMTQKHLDSYLNMERKREAQRTNWKDHFKKMKSDPDYAASYREKQKKLTKPNNELADTMTKEANRG